MYSFKADRRRFMVTTAVGCWLAATTTGIAQDSAYDRETLEAIKIFHALPLWAAGKTDNPEIRNALLGGLRILAQYDSDRLRVVIMEVTKRWRAGDREELLIAQNVYVLNRYLFEVPHYYPLMIRDGTVIGFWKNSGMGAGFPDLIIEFDTFRKRYRRRKEWIR